MGRGGIHRRDEWQSSTKNKSFREPDVIGDLRDQAKWSSYTQDIPRLGDDYRESLRLKRIHRAASRATTSSTYRSSRDWLMAVGVTVLVGLAIGCGVWLLVTLLRFLF